MGLKIGGKIEKINGKEVSYKVFVERYLEKNQPVVLTGLMDDGWRACSDWVTEDGKPNLHFLSSHFGKSRVQVAECGRREFTDQKRVEMSVSEFIDHWLEFSSQEFSNPPGCESSDQSPLYLKDWHFVKEYPDYVAYTTPLFFRDDWLNLYLDSYSMHMDPDSSQDKNEINCSDYRFVYMGSKGTWTPLHADVFRSYSWSANVCGKKQWHFLSPSQCHLVFDRHMKSSVYDIFDDVCETKFPGFKKAIWLECVQEQNEIIFVPSGWYHQVHNMEDTISINHNWFNGYNLSWVWKLLLKDYNEAKEYIEDVRDICDDFEGLCQRNLAANTGMNFRDFFVFVIRFSLAILAQLYLLVKDSGNDILDTFPSAQNLISSLTSIKKVGLDMNTVESLRGKNSRSISDDFSEILKDPDFIKLCMGLHKAHGMIDEQQSCNIAVDFEDLCFATEGKVISSPNDLIRVIESVVTNLCTNYSDVSCSSFLAEQDELTAFNPVL